MKNSIGGDPFKVRPSGSPPPNSARRNNLLSEMAKLHQAARGGQTSPTGDGGRSSIFDPAIIQNTTGSTVDRFGVLGIKGVIIQQTENDTYFKARIQFTGETPTAEDDFVIALAPICAGSIGPCCAWGITPAYVNMVNADDGWADVKNGDATQLQSSAVMGAAEILYTPGGTGKQLCIIRIGNYLNQSARVVEVTGNATCGGVYTAREWKRPTANITAMSNTTFSMSDLGTDPGADDGYVFHLPETGKTTHDLTATANAGNAKLVLAMLWYINSDGKNIYIGIQVYPGCS